MRVWSLKTHEPIATLTGHTDAVCALALDANFLFSAAEDGCVRLWDLHSHAALSAWKLHAGPVRGLLIVPDSGWLVTCCSQDQTVRVWDYASGNELKVWSHSEAFKCIALKRSTGHVVAGTEEHHLISFPLSDVHDAIQARVKEAEEAAREAEEELRRAEQLAAHVEAKKAGRVIGGPLAAGRGE